MDGSISDVFLRCMSESKKSVDQKGRAYKCPFHESSTYKLYLYEDKSGYRCYSGKCPYPNGGIIQLVMAFGFSRNHTEASHWLSDKGLIARCNGDDKVNKIVVRSPPDKYYVKPQDLNPVQKECWWYGQIHLIQILGNHESKKMHMLNAETNYQNRQERLKKNRLLIGDMQEWAYEQWAGTRLRSDSVHALRIALTDFLQEIYRLDDDSKITEDAMYWLSVSYEACKVIRG